MALGKQQTYVYLFVSVQLNLSVCLVSGQAAVV